MFFRFVKWIKISVHYFANRKRILNHLEKLRLHLKGLSSSEMMKSFEIKARVPRTSSIVSCPSIPTRPSLEASGQSVRGTRIKMQRNRTSLIFQHRFSNRHVTNTQFCSWILRNVFFFIQGSGSLRDFWGNLRSNKVKDLWVMNYDCGFEMNKTRKGCNDADYHPSKLACYDGWIEKT